MPECKMEGTEDLTNVESGIHPSFLVGIIVVIVVVTDNSAIQISGAGASLGDFGASVGWLELNGVGPWVAWSGYNSCVGGWKSYHRESAGVRGFSIPC